MPCHPRGSLPWPEACSTPTPPGASCSATGSASRAPGPTPSRSSAGPSIPRRLAAFAASPPELREGVGGWISQSAGPVGTAIMRCVLAGFGADAVPIGLACRVLFGEGAEGEPALRQAAVRLEPLMQGHAPSGEEARGWADAAEAVLRGRLDASGRRAADPWLARADALLGELRAEGFAYRSPVLLLGFEQRLERYGAALAAALQGTRPLGDVEVAGPGRARPRSRPGARRPGARSGDVPAPGPQGAPGAARHPRPAPWSTPPRPMRGTAASWTGPAGPSGRAMPPPPWPMPLAGSAGRSPRRARPRTGASPSSWRNGAPGVPRATRPFRSRRCWRAWWRRWPGRCPSSSSWSTA